MYFILSFEMPVLGMIITPVQYPNFLSSRLTDYAWNATLFKLPPSESILAVIVSFDESTKYPLDVDLLTSRRFVALEVEIKSREIHNSHWADVRQRSIK
jgi:hypothetical protein